MGGGSSGQYIGAGIGAVIGGVAGFFMGGPAGAVMGVMYGASLGYGVGGMVDPPETPEQDIDKQDLQLNTFQRNLPVPIVYGRNKVFGNLIWIGNSYSRVHTTGGGGKGGGGGAPKQKQVEYFADFALAISEGEIGQILQVFLEDKDITDKEGGNWIGYKGSNDQPANSLVQKAIPNNTPAWRNTAYIIWTGSLGRMNRLPIVSAVIDGIPGGIPGGFEIGTWENNVSFPFNGGSLKIYPTGNSDLSKFAALKCNWNDSDYYMWDTTNGWVFKSNQVGGQWGSPSSYPAYWKGKWWFSFGWPPTLKYTSDLVSFTSLSFNVGSTSTYNPIYVFYPDEAADRLYFSRRTWSGSNMGTSLLYVSSGYAVNMYASAWPTNDFVPGGSKNLSSNMGGLVQDVSGQNRFIAFCWAGSSLFLYYSAPNSPSSMTEVNITSYIQSMDGTITWSKPVGVGSKFYWIAKARSDGQFHLFSCDYQGNVEKLTSVWPDSQTEYLRVCGMFYWKGKLWVGLNKSGHQNYNAFWGYYDFALNIMVYPDWPNYPNFGGADLLPEYYEGAQHTDPTDCFFHDANYLRSINAKNMSGGGGRYDIRCEVRETGFDNSPAASIWDFLTNTRYGMGIPEDKLDQSSFEEAHNYCMEVLGDDEPRYTLDIVLGSEKSALDHLVMMLQSFGGFLVWSEGVIKLKVEKPETSVASLPEADI